MLVLWFAGVEAVNSQSVRFDTSGHPALDSLQLVIGTDTVKVKRSYSIDFPLYQVTVDTSIKKTVQNNGDEQSYGSELNATGSISRGIQVSTNASVSLQSSLYLKIRGSLGENYTVSGVLTERTTALQPIGNTRRLNDFDRVLVTIKGPAATVSVGDIDLQTRNGRFGNLDRAIEGLDLMASSGLASVKASLGFSYGQYHFQYIQGKDGKQGPYRLSGRNGEKFIIVIAGSEKVKIDDKTLQRGADGDYIIDYNAAEITFTQKRILSNNSRISIEFEYVPDIYLASYSFGKQLMSGSISLGTRNASPFYLSANWQEFRDDETNPLGNADADQLKGVFSVLADSVQTTWVSSIIPDSINGDYHLGTGNVLSYAGDGLGEYSVNFSFVGLAEGKYRKELGAIEDYFVYDTLQGEYLPARKLLAPQSHAVLSVVGGARLGSLALDTDLGISRIIHNLYALDLGSPDRKAWDVNLKVVRPRYELVLGEKYYEAGFQAHDKLESLEYYRAWRLSPRNTEEEQLNYARVRLGRTEGSYVQGEGSRLSRSGESMGQQMLMHGVLKSEKMFQTLFRTLLSDLGNDLGQEHSIRSTLTVNRFKTELNLGMEAGQTSAYYPVNDHITGGLGFFYDFSSAHKLALHYDQRLDYRLDGREGSILDRQNVNRWSDQRQDWAAEYMFSEYLNTSGDLTIKFRELLNDSSVSSTYGLVNFKLNSKALDDRIRYSGQYLIDEEYVPKYDFQYIQVDTGYGEYSYDPYIKDYIPLNGGRFIRQRVFSDAEEHVRKFENRTHLEYSSHSFNKKNASGVRARINSETRRKLQVQSGNRLQDQMILGLDLNYRTGDQALFRQFNYSGRATNNHSELYNYGAETTLFTMHELNAQLVWDARNASRIGIEYEQRSRDIEYNSLAQELWRSYRPFGRHTFIYSSKQKFVTELKYSGVADLNLDQSYSEILLSLDHNLNYRRRGRIEQKILLSYIRADINGLPYSIFSGRQAGYNWKYNLSGRYTFSNSFQLAMNYSMEERGSGRREQFMRLEGRTHF